MNIIYHRLARHYRLSDSVFWVLYLLGEARGPMTQTKLCSALFLSKQTVNSALKSWRAGGICGWRVCPATGATSCCP